MSEEAMRRIGASAVDLAELRRRAGAALAGAGRGTLESLEELAVGGASLTYSGIVDTGRAEARVVLKLAPPGVMPVRNRDVLRQARIMQLVGASSEIRVPTVLCRDAGDPPDVAPFFVMSHEPGDCLEPILSDAQRLPRPAEVEGRARHAARMLAALHAVDPQSLEVGDEPTVPLLGEVERWAASFCSVDADLATGAERVAEALAAEVPDPGKPAIVHGDYRLGNMLCVQDRVSAIIDWELWSVSDRRLDLAWLRLHCRASANPNARIEAPGMPSADELAEEYATASGTPFPQDLPWFDALVRFKQAAAAALLVKHARRREGPEARRRTVNAIPRQLAEALALVAQR